ATSTRRRRATCCSRRRSLPRSEPERRRRSGPYACARSNADNRLAPGGAAPRMRVPPRPSDVSALSAASVLRGLRPSPVFGCRQDGGNVRVGHVARPPLGVPVEDRPDRLALARVAEDDRSLRAVLLARLRSAGGEGLHEAVDVLDLCGCEQHLVLLSVSLV